MTNQALQKLEVLNQLRLTEPEREDALAFFQKREAELEALKSADVSSLERMVHVMPLETVVREDIEKKLFSRDELQRGAPETQDGYWQVPRVLE